MLTPYNETGGMIQLRNKKKTGGKRYQSIFKMYKLKKNRQRHSKLAIENMRSPACHEF